MTPYLTIRDRVEIFLATQVGQALLAFLRVVAVTFLAGWTAAGTPVFDMTLAMVADWLELAIQAGVALVMLNYVGPWEQRYGRGSYA